MSKINRHPKLTNEEKKAAIKKHNRTFFLWLHKQVWPLFDHAKERRSKHPGQVPATKPQVLVPSFSMVPANKYRQDRANLKAQKAVEHKKRMAIHRAHFTS